MPAQEKPRKAIAAVALLLVGFARLASANDAPPDWSAYIGKKCLTGYENSHSSELRVTVRAGGKIIPPGGVIPRKFDVEVTAPRGANSLEITRGTPMIDSERNLANGCADYLFTDAADFKGRHTYHVTLTTDHQGSPVSPGTIVFIGAFHLHSELTYQGYFLEKMPEDRPSESPGQKWQESRQRYLSGMLYFEKGDYENARTEWAAAVKLDPTNTDAQAGLDMVGKMLGAGKQ